jgi:hypothetical protein
MDTALNLKETDPRHVLVARADEELAHAYEQITRAGEELARAEKQLSKLEHDAILANRSLFDRPAVRGLMGLLLAACIGAAAFAAQSPYGDAVKEIIARWAPQLVLTSSLPLEKPGLPAQSSRPAVQAAAANAAPAQPAPSAQTAPETVAPTVAALSPETTQLLQSMAHDLAAVGQEIERLKASIEQLKTNQEQMARDNAKAAEQLKANQEQVARVIAKTSEAKTSGAKVSGAKTSQAKASGQNLPPKISATPPRPTATATRKPAPTP